MSTRRSFMAHSAAAASTLAFPLVGGAQPKTVKVGVLHPVTGALAYSGQQCREGALMAIEDINKAGGIKSLGGAKIEALLADAQSTPQAGAAEIEKINEAGASAVVGAFASAICLATTQAAAKYNLPHVVDVGVADQITKTVQALECWPEWTAANVEARQLFLCDAIFVQHARLGQLDRHQ